MVLLLLHLLPPGPPDLLPLQLLSIVSLKERVKVKLDLPPGVGEVPRSVLLLDARRFGGGGGPPGALQVQWAQDPTVILSPQANVPQHHVGLTDLREALRGDLVARVFVRVVDEGLFVVGGLDLGLRGTRGHSEDVIIGRPAFV